MEEEKQLIISLTGNIVEITLLSMRGIDNESSLDPLDDVLKDVAGQEDGPRQEIFARFIAVTIFNVLP